MANLNAGGTKALMARLLKPLIAVVALALVFEEWLWDALKAQLHRLSGLPAIHRMELWLQALPPWASLGVMLVPALALLPFKLAALWALANGHPVLGVLAFVMAKLTGTALAAYLFDLVRDRARLMPWFDTLYTAILRWLSAARAWLAAQPGYVWARSVAKEAKGRMRGLMTTVPVRRSVWQRRVAQARLSLARWFKGPPGR